MSTIATSKDALAQAKTRMEKAVEDFRKELGSVRTGRANTALLDHVRVDYHGTAMPLNQLGTLNVPDASTIVISPWDPGAVALRSLDELEKVTHSETKKIEDLSAAKEKEVMEIK